MWFALAWHDPEEEGAGASSRTFSLVAELPVGWVQLDEVPDQIVVPPPDKTVMHAFKDVPIFSTFALPLHEMPVAGSQLQLQLALPGLKPLCALAPTVGYAPGHDGAAVAPL